jgi:hypothetical protein
MVADVAVMPPAVTALMTGIEGGVEKVKFADVAGPDESADMTA